MNLNTPSTRPASRALLLNEGAVRHVALPGAEPEAKGRLEVSPVVCATMEKDGIGIYEPPFRSYDNGEADELSTSHVGPMSCTCNVLRRVRHDKQN